MEKKNVMSEEMAMQEINRWADENEIDIYVKGQNGEKLLDASIPKLVSKIQSGALVVNENGCFEYTVSDKSPTGYAGEKIVFKTPDGGAFMAMDKFKEHEGIHKTLAVASAMTGQDIRWFANVAHNDYKVISIITSFFIAG